jgi:CubicO group peptidase (beta-lactamase class C family)
MTKLSPHSRGALERVVRSQLAYKNARETFEAELQAELEAKLETFVSERNTAVRLADIAGVPRTQIGRALGTTNYRTVQEILEQTEGFVQSSDSATANWSVVETPEGWELTIHNLGAGGVTGTAIVAAPEDELIYVDGDPFVVPQVYRNGIAQEIIDKIR